MICSPCLSHSRHSSESEESLTGGLVEGAELVPQASKILDTSLNFRLSTASLNHPLLPQLRSLRSQFQDI